MAMRARADIFDIERRYREYQAAIEPLVRQLVMLHSLSTVRVSGVELPPELKEQTNEVRRCIDDVKRHYFPELAELPDGQSSAPPPAST